MRPSPRGPTPQTEGGHHEGRAEAIWAERDRKLAPAREVRAARRAEARRRSEPQELLTNRKGTPMLHPAGETDPGTLSLSKGGEQPARDSRLGCGREAGAGMGLRDYPRTPLEPFGPSPNASGDSRLPQASDSLISDGRLSSSP